MKCYRLRRLREAGFGGKEEKRAVTKLPVGSGDLDI